MGKYDALDEKIIDAIDGMKKPAFGDLLAYLHPSLSFHTSTEGEVFRTLDKRLQALRKKGLVEFAGKGWRKVS
jgi:hypothetical protein